MKNQESLIKVLKVKLSGDTTQDGRIKYGLIWKRKGDGNVWWWWNATVTLSHKGNINNRSFHVQYIKYQYVYKLLHKNSNNMLQINLPLK